MFEDVGKKIKKIAKGYFVASIILGFIIAIVLFVIAANSHDEVLWIISGLATMVIIPFVAWLSSLILYGFGEIVDTAIINRGKMPVITTTNTVQPTAVSPAVSEKKAKESNAVAINEGVSVSSKTNVTTKGNKIEYADTSAFVTTENNKIICSQCNFEQPNNRKICWHCGAKFETNENSAKPKNQKPCQLCGKESEKLLECKITDDFGTRYRLICDECIEKHNATPV